MSFLGDASMVRSSFYAASRIARIVQIVRDRLKSRIKIHTSRHQPRDLPDSKLKHQLHNTTNSYIKKRPTILNFARRNSLRRKGPPAEISKLLQDLDSHALVSDFSLSEIASQDRLFLSHSLHFLSVNRKTSDLRYLLNITTSLLAGVQSLSISVRENITDYVSSNFACDDFKCEKFLANLEHLLLCLQNIALEAIIHHYVDLFEAQFLRWYQYWQHKQRAIDDWFAEWPNGQPPLNTTWPWNVKPCLLVLWGVCWMFHGNERRHSRNPVTSGEDDFWTRRNFSQAETNAPIQTIQTTEAWTGVAYPNYSWLHPHEAGATPRHANQVERLASDDNSLPGYPVGVSTYPYITPSPYLPSDLFPASTVAWPYSSSINTPAVTTHDSDFNTWQPTARYTGAITATPERVVPPPSYQAYAPSQPAQPRQTKGGPVGGQAFNLGQRIRNMQDYPSPQHSDVSAPSTSSRISVLPAATLSPSLALVAAQTSSVTGISGSIRGSEATQAPIRNSSGLFYCSHSEHATTPVFARKSEWTKHMDKHNRPYICDEPGCETIRGFTYSGGLTRHQREVHHQHGGPKASRMCPYPTCKRSTGRGFSRKENLQEHMRRCHKEPNSEGQPSPVTPSVDLGELAGSRKRRRRDVDDDDDEDDDDGGSDQDQDHNEDEGDAPHSPGVWKREVKKLRRELREKDDRLRRLEEQMDALARGTRWLPPRQDRERQ